MKRLIFLALVSALVFAWGCSKKVQPETETVVIEEETVVVEKSEQKVLSPMEIYEQEYAKLPKSHTVSKGECLWWIAEYQQIYNDPFMWPLIYKANRDQIDNPDLIYPGQTFSVPRTGFDLAEVKDARKQAGAPWKALEPGADAVVPAKMRADLGYSF